MGLVYTLANMNSFRACMASPTWGDWQTAFWERLLNEVMPGGFAHYKQSLRVVERLEKAVRSSFKNRARAMVRAMRETSKVWVIRVR